MENVCKHSILFQLYEPEQNPYLNDKIVQLHSYFILLCTLHMHANMTLITRDL